MSLFDENKCGEIVRRINELNPESQALWGKMSVNQMLCHLADALKMATSERAVADKSNFAARTILKPLVLYVLPIPKNVPTAKELDQSQGGTPPTDFATDKKDLLACIEKMCALEEDFAWAPHAKFGRMNRREWGLLAHKHIDHHLKQFGL
jgi:hypothetical protein